MLYKRAICRFLAIIISLLILGCQAPQATKQESPVQQAQAQADLYNLFTYDAANTMQFDVKAALPGEEEAYEYPWGAYDDPIDMPPDGALPSNDTNAAIDTDEDEREKQLQEALNKLAPEKRQAAEEAMAKAKEQAPANAPQGEPELPQDWNKGSNQAALGGGLAFSSGDTGVIIEMSEYAVDADTTFTVMPIKESKLPPEFMQGGFSLSSNGNSHVVLHDAAVITFITKDDPGEDAVIKSFSETGEMEYTAASVMKLGDTYRITGAVGHFSTVGYGAASLPALAPQISPEATEALRKFAQEELERMRREQARKDAKKKVVRTIEFDEILYTKSASGHPLQLHLRAKLVETPKTLQGGVVSLTERVFEGKIWIKFYTWMPGGYGVIYMLCNNAVIEDPNSNSSIVSLTEPGVRLSSATIPMATIGGSQSVGEGVGAFDISGKTYSNVQTAWAFDTATGSMKVTFANMKGAIDKTFITGKLRAVTERQASKKLKWFLD